jgi:VanZ family protein
LTVGYAIFDEIHQGFAPGRHATRRDVIIDALGATVAVFLMSRWPQASDPGAPATR